MRRFVSVPRLVQGSMCPCPSPPLVDADRSLRIAGQLGQRRDSSALALYGRPP